MDTTTQIQCARSAALAIPSPRATLVVTGKDRLTWLNGLVTCDLVKNRAGVAAYGLVVGRNGRILADVAIVADDGRLLLSVPAATVGTLTAHFEHYLVMEDAETIPGSEEFEVWAVHGPRAMDVLATLRAVGGVGAEFDRTGLGGAVVFVPRACGVEARASAGKMAGDIGIAVGSAAGWEALRLERGVPEFGADFDDTTYPQEAALERVAVSFDKGCYLGQEVVCMLELRGHVKRKLAALVVDAQSVPTPGTAVTDAVGASIGHVTSAVLSPTLARPVALAMLKRGHAEVGSHVAISGASADVVERPA